MGLFNPFLDLDETLATSLAIAQWNDAAYAFMHTNPNMILVPTADLFEKNLSKYIYTDHFHPESRRLSTYGRACCTSALLKVSQQS